MEAYEYAAVFMDFIYLYEDVSATIQRDEMPGVSIDNNEVSIDNVRSQFSLLSSCFIYQRMGFN